MDNFIAQPANPYFNRFVVQLFDFTCAYLRADEAEGACDQLMSVARDNGIGTSLPENLADTASVKAWWLKAITGILVDERTIGHTNETIYNLTDTAVHLARVATGTRVERAEIVRSITEDHRTYGYIDDEEAHDALRDSFGDNYINYFDRLISYEDVAEAMLREYQEYRLDEDVASQYHVIGNGDYVVER